MIDHPMCNHLKNKAKFDIDGDYVRAFNYLKGKPLITLTVVASNLLLLFEFMYDTNKLALDTVHGKAQDKLCHSIYYATKFLNNAQRNYTVMEQEFLAIVYAF